MTDQEHLRWMNMVLLSMNYDAHDVAEDLNKLLKGEKPTYWTKDMADAGKPKTEITFKQQRANVLLTLYNSLDELREMHERDTLERKE